MIKKLNTWLFHLYVTGTLKRVEHLSPLVTFPFTIFLELEAKPYFELNGWKKTLKYIQEYPNRLKLSWERSLKAQQLIKDKDYIDAYEILEENGYTYKEINELIETDDDF